MVLYIFEFYGFAYILFLLSTLNVCKSLNEIGLPVMWAINRLEQRSNHMTGNRKQEIYIIKEAAWQSVEVVAHTVTIWWSPALSSTLDYILVLLCCFRFLVNILILSYLIFLNTPYISILLTVTSTSKADRYMLTLAGKYKIVLYLWMWHYGQF